MENLKSVVKVFPSLLTDPKLTLIPLVRSVSPAGRITHLIASLSVVDNPEQLSVTVNVAKYFAEFTLTSPPVIISIKLSIAFSRFTESETVGEILSTFISFFVSSLRMPALFST